MVILTALTVRHALRCSTENFMRQGFAQFVLSDRVLTAVTPRRAGLFSASATGKRASSDCDLGRSLCSRGVVHDGLCFRVRQTGTLIADGNGYRRNSGRSACVAQSGRTRRNQFYGRRSARLECSHLTADLGWAWCQGNKRFTLARELFTESEKASVNR